MTKNPFINAFAATAYITCIASFMFYGVEKSGPVNSVLVPIAMVSLFTLSAAVMGYLFLFQPAQLYFDGKKKDAVNLFLQTVAVFAATTIAILAVAFSGVLT